MCKHSTETMKKILQEFHLPCQRLNDTSSNGSWPMQNKNNNTRGCKSGEKTTRHNSRQSYADSCIFRVTHSAWDDILGRRYRDQDTPYFCQLESNFLYTRMPLLPVLSWVWTSQGTKPFPVFSVPAMNYLGALSAGRIITSSQLWISTPNWKNGTC